MKNLIGFPVFGWVGVPTGELFSTLETLGDAIVFEASESVAEMARSSIQFYIEQNPGFNIESGRSRFMVEERKEIRIQGTYFSPAAIVIFSSEKTCVNIGFGVANTIDQAKLKLALSDLIREDDRLFLITKTGKGFECYGDKESAEKYLKSQGYKLDSC